MVSEKLGAAFMEVGADLGPLEKSLGSIPGMMQHAGTNITGGLKASLQGGNFTDVGKQLGNQLVTGMTSQFGMLGQAAGTFATALGPAGIALLGIGASVAVIGVGLGKCVSSAATWQDLMVDVQKVTTTTESQFSKLSSDLLAIRGSTGASMESIAGAAAGAGRMGIDPDEIAGYTEVILKMSSAWEVPADASSDAIGKIGAAVKPAEMAWADFANRSGSLINDLADTTVTSEEAIIQGLSKLTGSMKDFKVQPEQLAGWASMVAYLQEMGDTDVGAGEHIKDALREITKTTHGEDIAALIGVDFGELQEMIRTDTIGTFEELAAAIADLPLEEQGDAFALFGDSGAEAMKKFAGGVDKTTGSISRLDEIAATGKSAWEDASSLDEQYAKSQETLNAQIDIFKGKISVAATSIGSVLLPHLTDAVAVLAGGVEWATNFGQSLYGIGQAVDSALEPLGGLFGVLGKMTLIGPALDVAGKTAGFIGSLTSDISSKATGDINIGGEWYGSTEDLTAARDAGKLTGEEYLNGIRDLIKSKSDITGIDTSRLTQDIKKFAETGELSSEQYISALGSVAGIYEQIGDSAYEMAEPVTEAFENGTISAEDYISILEDMADVTETIGEDAEDVITPLTEAFENGSLSVEDYKSVLDTLSKTTSSLGADFDSIAGPIQDAFADGELSVEQYQTALETVTRAHNQLGASTQNVLAPITEMFESGEISADEYIVSLNAVLAGVDSWGPEFNRRMADLNAKAGDMSAEEYMTAFNAIISDLNIDIEKVLESVDSEGAGSAAGSGYMKAWNDEMKRWADYHEKTVQRFSRTGTVSAGSDTIEFIKTADSYLNWAVHINGKSLTGSAYESEQAAMDAIRTQFPGLWALMDPSELKAAILEAHGNFGEAAEIRAQLELGTPWERFVEELAPTQAQIAEIQAAYEKTYAEAFKTGAFIGDMESAMKDLGDTGAKAFSDGWISGTEAQDMVNQLIQLQFSDPEAFAAAGGEEALNFWRGMQEKLTDLSVAIATGADPDSIREMIADIKSDLDSSEFKIDITAEISKTLFGREISEKDIPALADLIADPEALEKTVQNWEQWSANTYQPALQHHIDEAEAKWASGYYSQSELNKDYFQDLMTNALQYSDWYEGWQLGLLGAYARGDIGLQQFFDMWETGGKAVEAASKAIAEERQNLASLTAEAAMCEEAMSSFGIAQEKMSDQLFNRSYIGPTSGYAAFLEEERARGAFHPEAQQLSMVYRVEADTTAAEKSVEDLKTDIDQSEAAPQVHAVTQPAYDEVDKLVGWVNSISASIYVGAYGPGTEYMGDGGYLEGLSPGITSSPGWGTSSWLPVLDSGGIVTGPTIASLAQDNRPEAIIPLDQITKIIGGGGNTYNISVNGGGNAEEIARAIRNAIEDYDRTKNRAGAYA